MRIVPTLLAASVLAFASPARAQDATNLTPQAGAPGPTMLEDVPPPPPGPNAPRLRTMPRDRTMMWAGGLLTLAGGSALLVGSAMVEARRPGDGNGTLSGVTFFGGLGALATGLPLFLWGAKRVPVVPAMGPRSVGFVGAF
jgi:hypothetical protein